MANSRCRVRAFAHYEQEKKPMLSQKKIAANKNNAKRSSGPKTDLGKQRSKRNALKHGILSCELLIDANDKVKFETLRSSLRHDLFPETTLQQVGFERLLISIQKSELALRLEAKQLKATFEQLDGVENAVPESRPAQNLLPPNLYYADRTARKAALSLLSRMRSVIEESGFLHAEDLKTEIVRVFGEEYFFLLTRWAHMSPSAIKMAMAIDKHKQMFGSTSPAAVESKHDDVVLDPLVSLQMAVKLIQLTQQHVESLLRMDGLHADGAGHERDVSAVELATRYYTTATRELERAVNWYRYLKEHRL
jgi:hypothetical protein